MGCLFGRSAPAVAQCTDVVVGLHPVRAAYVVVFALTAVGCFAAVGRARVRVSDRDTRWGLVALLATSGLWAAFHVGRIAAPTVPMKLTFYVLGLVTGLSTVGAWLYFCSAYAGESYHRQSGIRRLALGIYLAVVAVKLTSPIHGLYFTATAGTEPFSHLDIHLGVLHWIVTGVAYALSAIGFYVLYDVFRESRFATRQLGLLVGLAALPVVFDLVGYLAPSVVITLNYEPIGVALFAVGVLYVADGRFIAVRRFSREQLFDQINEGVVVLDADGVIRDVNRAAAAMFPELVDAVGRPLSAVAPNVAAARPFERSEVVAVEGTEPATYVLVDGPELSVGQTTFGRALVLTDVTDIERQRREIERQHEQFDDFAEAITHELRNTVGIVEGHLGVAEARLDSDADPAAVDSIATAGAALDRITTVIGNLATLAEYGSTAAELERVDVGRVAEAARTTVRAERSGPEVSIDEVEALRAHEPRLERLFAALFRFAGETGVGRVHLSRSGDELCVEMDANPLADGSVEEAFSYGQAVPSAESGLFLPVVQTLASAHGWEIEVDAEGAELRLRILTDP